MKLKVNRKTLALLALTSATIFSGCTAQKKNNTKDKTKVEQETKKEKKEISSHYHLIIDFDNQQFIFRECEDNIEIMLRENNHNSNISYDIYDDNDKPIFEGGTGDFNIFYVNNNIEEENARGIEKILIDKGAKVYQLEKK